jgi:hypothetical protein
VCGCGRTCREHERVEAGRQTRRGRRAAGLLRLLLRLRCHGHLHHLHVLHLRQELRVLLRQLLHVLLRRQVLLRRRHLLLHQRRGRGHAARRRQERPREGGRLCQGRGRRRARRACAARGVACVG